MKKRPILLYVLYAIILLCNFFWFRLDWLTLVVLVLSIITNFHDYRMQTGNKRLRRMMYGALCLCVSFAIILAAALFGVVALTDPFISVREINWWLVGAAALVLVLFLVIGYFLILFNSRHLRVVWRVLLLFTWWIPLWNIYLFIKVLYIVNQEFKFELSHEEIMELHAENADCATKYPILMVHGIFFRDWQLVNYWGRIPKELTRCGAKIYYGGQQSAAPVAESAGELSETIKKLVEEQGCEKVNIIAHSKGGLDSRYAISKLGMAPYVSSLTTINTPHRGCVWARALIERLPEAIVNGIAKRYNMLFKKLGDKAPDFLGGVLDLTDSAARAFNERVPDAPGVLYQSVMSVMSGASSAGFPLNLGYRFALKYDRECSDGLVARSSAPWGNFLGEVATKQTRGVSHGDMVDLFREDIPGFDVAAYYVSLVRELKAKGF